MLSGSFNLDIQELCRPCNKCTISVRWFTSVKDIKDLLKLKLNAPPSQMSIFCISNPKSLRNQTTLHDLGIEQSGHTLRVAINMTSNTSFQLLPSKDINVDDNCKDMISLVRQGFERSQVPGKTDLFDCTGGVYFLKAPSGEKIAVFKPNDEEQGMPSNPKGHAGNGEEGLRPFFRPGHGYIRETAAYLMDFKNFCQVPPTTIVHCEHSSFHYPTQLSGSKVRMYPKVGSLQSFVYAGDTFEDISPSLIGTLELQKIAILDIRLLNCDRNSSNILAIRKAAPNTFHNGTRCRRDSRSSSMGSYTTDEFGMMSCEDAEFNPFQEDEVASASYSSASADMFELIPIDHGYCIPSRLRIDELDWIWFYCPQIAKEVDPEIRRYVASLDIDQMMNDLDDQLKIDEYSCFLLRLAHRVLVSGIAAGLTLFDIAQMVARTDEDRPSPLEKVIKSAEDNAFRALEMRSNRLNSRGMGNSRQNLYSQNTKSPVRFNEEFGAGQLPRQSKTPLSSQQNKSPGLSRVVQSASNLADMDRGGDLSPTSPRTRKSLKLSSENIEKLQLNSPHLVSKFPSVFANQQQELAPHLVVGRDGKMLSDSPVGDFYMAELSPQPQQSSLIGESVSLGLSKTGGDKLKIMHSVDSAVVGSYKQPFNSFSSLSGGDSATTAAFSAVSSSKMKLSGSYLRTGVLPTSGDEDALNQKSEPILLALRDSNSSGYSDATTSSEVSKEADDDFSPKSCAGRGFFASALVENKTATGTGKAVERPFPPRTIPEKARKADFGDSASTSSEEGVDVDGETSAEERLMRDVSIASFSSFRSGGALNNLHRIASFNAFESPSIYEETGGSHGKTCDRQLKMLHREQHKAEMMTSDFQELRLKFAYEAIDLLTSKRQRRGTQ